MSGSRVLSVLLLAAATGIDGATAQATSQQIEDLAGPTAFTPDALQGPPTPAVTSVITGMDERRMEQYVAAYRAHMAATWTTRWSLVSSVRMLDRAMENSDEDAARYYHVLAEQLWRKVSAQDTAFDISLSAILREDQLQRYRRWKQAWLRAAEAQRRMEGASGSGGS